MAVDEPIRREDIQQLECRRRGDDALVGVEPGERVRDPAVAAVGASEPGSSPTQGDAPMAVALVGCGWPWGGAGGRRQPVGVAERDRLRFGGA